MNPQFMHDLQYSGSKGQQVWSISYSQQKNDPALDDGDILVQRLPKRKIVSASRSRLLRVAFTSLAAAYFLLLCFHFIKIGRLLAPQSRYLADRYDGSCDWGNAAEHSDNGDSDNGDERTTGGTQEHRAQELTNEGLLSPHYQNHGVHESVTGRLEGVGVAASIGEETSGTSLVEWAQELQQYSLHSWENRNLPRPIRGRLVNLFSRMVRASRLCRSLLPMLTRTQRLRVTYLVMRLIALDLGAISLVREDMEPARQSVGNSLINLGHECLGSNSSGSKHGLRTAIRQLIELVEKLKLPRRVEHEYDSLKYRGKMLSMMGTAGLVTKYCLGVLEGLLQSICGGPRRLPDAVVQQQFSVLEGLYRVHADHIGTDRALRKHILKCQEQTSTYDLLGGETSFLPTDEIPKLYMLQKQIKKAVSDAGGLLPLEQPSELHSNSASSTLARDNQLSETYTEALYGQWGHHMLQGSSAAAEQQALHFTASSVSENVYGGASLPSAAYPLRQPWQLLYQGHESVAQPVPQVTCSPLNQQSQSVSSPSPQASGGSAMPWMHTARQHIQGAGPHLPLTPSLLACPHLLSATRSAESAFSLDQLQRHTLSGCVVQAPLGPTAQLRQRAGAEQPVTFESPAAGSQRSGYSLFGGGGVPPWLPFQQMRAFSVETRTPTGRSFLVGQTQGMRHGSTYDLNEAESSHQAGHFDDSRQ
ncbi:hypothetical protein ETH_00018585 [Eimeria tenella]|uniref:Uncharacterized protein n=1 Tax=Eimeria tenella TaxID=5802 RepID=U6KZW8_EIMTE|nr:hypothetical protein ETH_00018585 [Eimeria tenella]CDJ42458.1 hypothetical protein ETH_00018585 [Eimeria tenella]|eukprot:XP_013233208.1 hypothetical protein ETH_00018585 [Eimeria tenella]